MIFGARSLLHCSLNKQWLGIIIFFISVDGGYRESNKYMGIGVSAFHNGKLVAEISKWKRGGSSTDAELIAILLGMRLAIDLNVIDAYIATDCQSCISLINHAPADLGDCSNYRRALINSINTKRDIYTGLLVHWVNRNEIAEAHNLALEALERYRKIKNIKGLDM